MLYHYSVKFLFLIIGPVALGAFLRFSDFYEKIIFYGDHSRDFLTVYKIVRFQEWVFHGPAASVTWNLLSPVYYYLLLPFYLLTNWHPLTQIYLTALLSVVTIAVLFFCVRDLWGTKSGLIAALIYAVSSIIIPDNLVGLNPGLVPIGTVLLAWSFLKVLGGQDRYLWVSAASLAWVISFHASSFFIVPPLVIVWLWKRPRVNQRNLLVACLTFFIIAVIPYAIQEKKHGGYNFITVKNYFFSTDVTPKSQQEYVALPTSLSNFAQIIAKTPAEFLLPLDDKLLGIVNLLIWGSALLFLKKNKAKLDRKFVTLLVILATYTLLFGLAVKFRTPTRPNWWFSNIFFPLFTITCAYFLSQIKQRIIITFVLFAIVVTNVLALQKYTANQSFARYSQEQTMARTILNNAKLSNFNFKYIYQNHIEDGATGPFTYLFWYLDKPANREKYFRWLNWQKPPADFPLYLIFQETSPSDKEAWLSKYNDHSQSLIEQTNFYEIYKIM